MSILLLGITLVVFSVASMLDAARISETLRQPGVFDLVGPDRYLMGTGILLLVLGVGLLYQGARQVYAGGRHAPGAGGDSDANTHLWLLGGIVVYAVLMATVGYTISTLVFFLIAFRVMGMRSWGWVVGSAVVVTSCFAILFRYAADMPLPKGWFGLG